MPHLPPGHSATDYWLPCKHVNPLMDQVRVNTHCTHAHAGTFIDIHSHSDKHSATLKQRLRLWQWDWNPVSLFAWRWRRLCNVPAGLAKTTLLVWCEEITAIQHDDNEQTLLEWQQLSEVARLGDHQPSARSINVFWGHNGIFVYIAAPGTQWEPSIWATSAHADKFICLCGDLCGTQSGISLIYSPPNTIAVLSLALAARHRLSYCSVPIC